MAGLILAIDQGTTNTKALLVGQDGKAVFRTSVPVEVLTPRAGFVEQDAALLWQSVVDVVQQCITEAGLRSIEGISISNQRETAVAWNRHTLQPVTNAISWQCRRTEDLCRRIHAHEQIIRQRTGLPLDPLISATKWSWLFENCALDRLARDGELCLGNIDSWLIYRLTQGSAHVTDHTNASRTGLLDLQSLNWSDELLTLFGIPRDAMPHLGCSASIFGSVSAIPELVGVPIVAAIGDSHAAMFGHGSYSPGTVKATYGTGSSLMTLTQDIPVPSAELARTIAWSYRGKAQYALEGNITMTGSAVQWVGQFLQLADPTADAVKLANTVEDSGGVYFVPAMVGLGAPHWDSAVRGTLTGLGRNSLRSHMARAALDAIAYQVADVFFTMQSATGINLPALNADGGATRNAALMQFQADVLQVVVHRSACEDLSALGAAWLGGLTLGWWQDLSSLESLPEPGTNFSPRRKLDREYTGWKHAVAQARLTESN